MGEYIVIYVLTLSLCVAPEGKTVCEPWKSHSWFHNAQDCVDTRYDYFILYDRQPSAILHKGETQCEVAIVHLNDYPTFNDVTKARETGEEAIRIAQELRDLIDNPDEFPKDTLQRLLERKSKLRIP